MSSSTVASVTNLIPTVNEGFTTTAGGTITSGATIVSLTSVAGLVNATIFVGIIEPGVDSKQQTFTGTVDTANSRITGVVWTRGANTSHAAGSVIVDYVTGTAINMIGKAFLTQHGQNGAHTAITATSASISAALTAATAAIAGATTVGGNLTVSGTARVVPVSITSSGTITPSSQIYNVTALATTASIAVPSFTAADGQAVIIRIKDNGTARALSFASGYTNVSGLTTPTTTVISKLLTIGALYNSATSKWEIQGINQEA